MIGRGRPVVVKGPDRLPGTLLSGPLDYARIELPLAIDPTQQGIDGVRAGH
jgi:hypothetical protein